MMQEGGELNLDDVEDSVSFHERWNVVTTLEGYVLKKWWLFVLVIARVIIVTWCGC